MVVGFLNGKVLNLLFRKPPASTLCAKGGYKSA